MTAGHQPGERVGAILSGNSEKVEFLGYGEYVGDVVPERPIGMMGEYGSWEAIAAMMNDSGFRPPEGSNHWTVEQVKMPNPLIRLDSGAEVWGAECWWGPAAKIKASLDRAREQGAAIVEVDPRTVKGIRAYEEGGDDVRERD